MKIPMFPGKYHQKGGFSMAMLVLGRVGGMTNLDSWMIFLKVFFYGF